MIPLNWWPPSEAQRTADGGVPLSNLHGRCSKPLPGAVTQVKSCWRPQSHSGLQPGVKPQVDLTQKCFLVMPKKDLEVFKEQAP